ncbi:hypothetical protein V6N11_051479 [Hibiscus sabdariffa]|uniref:Uncharacterized protein n=1 Tax=Hibiscus sabdariffa TaxID=183260 RepID=A0ABR2U791_9ROSI
MTSSAAMLILPQIGETFPPSLEVKVSAWKWGANVAKIDLETLFQNKGQEIGADETTIPKLVLMIPIEIQGHNNRDNNLQHRSLESKRILHGGVAFSIMRT